MRNPIHPPHTNFTHPLTHPHSYRRLTLHSYFSHAAWLTQPGKHTRSYTYPHSLTNTHRSYSHSHAHSHILPGTYFLTHPVSLIPIFIYLYTYPAPPHSSTQNIYTLLHFCLHLHIPMFQLFTSLQNRHSPHTLMYTLILMLTHPLTHSSCALAHTLTLGSPPVTHASTCAPRKHLALTLPHG